MIGAVATDVDSARRRFRMGGAEGIEIFLGLVEVIDFKAEVVETQ